MSGKGDPSTPGPKSESNKQPIREQPPIKASCSHELRVDATVWGYLVYEPGEHTFNFRARGTSKLLQQPQPAKSGYASANETEQQGSETLGTNPNPSEGKTENSAETIDFPTLPE